MVRRLRTLELSSGLLTEAPEYHHYNDTFSGISAYFKAIGVDQEDMRTGLLESSDSDMIKSCWDWILTRSEFEGWEKARETCVLWLTGIPGRGKTRMAAGLVDELMRAAQRKGSTAFVGFFFCQFATGKMNTVCAVLKGLIYGLGQEDRSLMQFLRDEFESPADIKGAPVRTLWRVLTKMLAACRGLGEIYFVIDALDECEQDRDLEIFLGLVKRSPFRRCVKWLFTSRRSHCLSRHLGSGAVVYEIDLDTPKEAKQVAGESPEIVAGANQQFPGPQKSHALDLLKSDADKTSFIARFVLGNLLTASDVDISMFFDVLENKAEGVSVYRLYRLYLQRVIERDDKSRTTTLQDLLKAVLLANAPLSLPEVAIAAGLPYEFYVPGPESGSRRKTAELIKHCGQILTVTENKVYMVHQSAKDYLTNGGGTDDSPFLSSTSAKEHALIAERCLKAMGPDLLPMPDLSTLEPHTVRVQTRATLQQMESVQYIYTHWLHHVLQAKEAFTNWKLVEQFLEGRFLPWVEGMGHLGQVPRCLDIIQGLRTAADSELHGKTTSEHSKALLRDHFQFLVRYRKLIQERPRHVYLLAKYFAPKTSQTRRYCENPSWREMDLSSCV